MTAIRGLRPSALVLVASLAIGCRPDLAKRAESAPDIAEASLQPFVADTNPVRHDDLQWLVGRWRCASRQYLVKANNLLSSHGEDSLDYFNVYYPYADDRLTLELTDNPEDRPIAAEFLVRRINEFDSFEESLSAMSPRSVVCIGKDRIWLRDSPFEVLEFRYKFEDRGSRLWLVLESKCMRLELYKLLAEVGDIKKSSAVAPIKDYPPERISELKRRYDELKSQKRILLRKPGEHGNASHR